jgi:CubicO group peptidase (beta-lactamase class C family)
MKKILITLLLLTVSSFVYADPWKGYPYNSSEIPEDAVPNEKILKHYLKKYISSRTREDWKIKVKATDNYKELNFKLASDDYVKKQMNETAMLSYLMYENGNVIIDEINEKYEKNFKNKTLYVSNSVGKSLVSYVTGHAICKGYISGINQPIDWDVLENTLYEGQPIINLLNMASGDHFYVDTMSGLINSKRWVNNVSIKSVMKKELKNSKKGRLKYNYSNLDTNIVASYVLYKMGNKEFKKLVKEILVDKAGIEHNVNLFKKNGNSISYGSYVSRYDYLRISIAMLEDWNNNTCEGQYLKSLYENKVNKRRHIGIEGFNITTSYAGQFHTDIHGIEDRPIFVMDGFGGQSHVIDFEKNRIISIMAIHRNYDWWKLVYKKLKQ